MNDFMIPVAPEGIFGKKGPKVTVVGCGAVGMASAYAIILKNIATNICLIDAVQNKVEGEVLDLQHGEQFLGGVKINGGTDFKDSADSEVVIITAGARQKEGESRLDLVQRNVDIFKSIVPNLVKYSPHCIFVIVSNPVDLMTYVTWKLSGFPKHKIIGTGTMLDSARFRCLLGKKLGVAASSVHGYIIGEHGDSSVAVWSCVNVAGVKLSSKYPKIGTDDDPEKFENVHKEVIKAAYELIKLKGYTSWAIGMTTAALVNAIMKNQRTVFPLSTCAKDIHGITQDIFISLPCLITSAGITHVIPQELSDAEVEKVQKSAITLNKIQEGIKW